MLGGGRSWVCARCGARFYLDQNDFNRKARWLVLLGIAVFVGALVDSATPVHVPWGTLVLPLMVVVVVILALLVTGAKSSLEPPRNQRRKNLFLGLGGLMGAIFFGGALLLYAFGDHYAWRFAFVLIPCLPLALVFFAIGFWPDR